MTIISTDRDSYNIIDPNQHVLIESDVAIGDEGVFAGERNDIIINRGTIIGTLDDGVYLEGIKDELYNYGTISGDFFGIGLYSKEGHIVNYGNITDAIDVLAKSNTIDNFGTISSMHTTIEENNIYNTLSFIENHGIITSGGVAFDGTGKGGFHFVNSGSIVGDVVFQRGLNVFDGRQGTVKGEIIGGFESDRIYAGNDGEEIAGGKRHDTIFGGTGADTFLFSSYYRRDIDTIHGFNVTNDTIQFDSTVFKHLVADQIVDFAIGNKSSDAKDFLFYNKSNGLLFYDVDGSGTAHQAAEIADLGKGLKLTASNFSVS